jgi:branched-chain amino acid transport system permease protein
LASTAVAAPSGVTERWRPATRGWVARGGVIVLLVAFIIFRLISFSPIWADYMALAAIYAIIGLSLNIVLGYTGQVSLGHHAFVGLAAFVAAHHLTVRAGCAPEEGCIESSLNAFFVGILVAVVVSALAAGLLGLIALRIKGLYLSLITLVYGFVAVSSLFELPALTRGGAGMPAPRPKMFATDHGYMFLCLLLLGLVLFIDWRFLRSKVGRAVLAVKESEAVAASYAVNVTVYKVMAFMLSGAFAGLAGALFAGRRQIVVANDFGFQIALLWVLMVVVGGLGSRLGVTIGSMFFALFPFLIMLFKPLVHFVEDTVQRDPEEFTLVIGPALALLTMIQFPGGIAEQISPITRWLGGQKFTMHPEGKKPKSHGGFLAKIGVKKHSETEAPPAEVLAPVVSAELLGDDASQTGGAESTGSSGVRVLPHDEDGSDHASEPSADPAPETQEMAAVKADEDADEEKS